MHDIIYYCLILHKYAALLTRMEEDHGVSQLNGPRSPEFWAPCQKPAVSTSYICTYVGCSMLRNFTRNHSHLFYPQSVAKILARLRSHKEINTFGAASNNTTRQQTVLLAMTTYNALLTTSINFAF